MLGIKEVESVIATLMQGEDGVSNEVVLDLLVQLCITAKAGRMVDLKIVERKVKREARGGNQRQGLDDSARVQPL